MTRLRFLGLLIAIGCADPAPLPERAVVAPEPVGEQGPDAALFLRCAVAIVPGIDPQGDQRKLVEDAIAENDYEGPLFDEVLSLLNTRMHDAGRRPLRRPLPPDIGRHDAR